MLELLWNFKLNMWAPPMEEFQSIQGFDCHRMHLWVQANKYVTPTAAVILYIVAIFAVIPFLRWRQKAGVPSWMSHLFAAWNLMLSLFSAYGVYVCLPFVFKMIREQGIHYAICSDHMMLGGKNGDNHVACFGEVGFMMTLFMLSKFPELVDTVFLVLMHKDVMFLHWYHHVTVLMYSWFAYHSATPSAVVFGTMNYVVHSVMYFYFFASPYTKALSFMRQPITMIQLLQMVVGVAITVLAYVFDKGEASGCSKTYAASGFFTFCLCLYGSYLVLFAKLYRDSYVSKTRKRAALEKKAK